jgi:iron complex outermembrane receptor protein
MLKNILPILFFLIACFHVSGQNANSIFGKITDSTTNEPLIGVSVNIKNTNIAVLTNADGMYNIIPNSSLFTIQINALGYETYIKEISITNISEYNFKLKSKQNELNTITISGSRFEKRISEETVSMEVVKPSQIKNAGITQVDDMLKRIPGVDVVDGQANIRGGSGWSYGAGSRVLVMVDDMPMLTSDAGDVKWDFLPIENCEQVEVIKGASSALYGSSALNGVINFRTAMPKNKPQTNITIQQGLYDLPKNKYEKWNGNDIQKFNGANFFHSRKIKQFDILVGGNYYSDDSYLQGNYNTRGRLNTNLKYRFKKIDGLQIGVNINVQKSKGSSFFIWGADDKVKKINGIFRYDSTAYLKPSGGVDTPKTSLSFYNSFRLNIDPYINYSSKSGYKFSLKNRFFNTENVNTSNQSSNAKFYYSEFQIQKNFNHNFHFTIGTVASYSIVKSELFSNHKINNQAFYIQMDKKLFSKVWLEIGGRYEFYKIDSVQSNSKPLGRIGINYQIAKATYIRSSFGMGYRFPTIAEKFVSTSVSSLKIIPNNNLKPESGWNAELGIKQNFMLGKWLGMIDIAGFYTRYKDMMEFAFIIIPQPGFQSQNISNTVIKGFDASVFTQGKINKMQLTAHAGFTYTNPMDLNFKSMNDSIRNVQYSDTTKNILKYRFTTSAKADIEVKWRKISFGSYVRYNTYMINIDNSLNSLFKSVKDYRTKWGHKDTWIIDVRIKYDLTPTASLSFIVKNILNFEYTERPAYIAPPRSFTLQFVYNL